MNAGQITLALTGVLSSSARSDRAQPTSPALVVAYGMLKALPARPASEEIITTWPRPRASIPGSA
jgi:hypothetical protein